MNLTVKVLDKATRQPIRDANVWLNEVQKGKTDANGNFTLNNLKDSDFVRVSFVGYGESFALASEFPSTVYLDNSGFALNEVIVKNVFKKTNWLMWLTLGIGATAIFAYAYKNQKAKTPIKAKI